MGEIKVEIFPVKLWTDEDKLKLMNAYIENNVIDRSGNFTKSIRNKLILNRKRNELIRGKGKDKKISRMYEEGIKK